LLLLLLLRSRLLLNLLRLLLPLLLLLPLHAINRIPEVPGLVCLHLRQPDAC
jgi:hypothetical protein